MIASSWVSADGYVVEDDSPLMTFLHSVEDDAEQDQYGIERLASAGEHAMGSATYRAFSSFWPQDTSPSGDAMNRTPKLVFTRGDVEASWGPVRVIRGEAAQELIALKAEEGGDILVHGGTGLVRSLLRQGAYDELQLLVLPVFAGAGTPLFEDTGHLQPMRLVSSRVFTSGVQVQVWRAPAESAVGAHPVCV